MDSDTSLTQVAENQMKIVRPLQKTGSKMYLNIIHCITLQQCISSVILLWIVHHLSMIIILDCGHFGYCKMKKPHLDDQTAFLTTATQTISTLLPDRSVPTRQNVSSTHCQLKQPSEW